MGHICKMQNEDEEGTVWAVRVEGDPLPSGEPVRHVYAVYVDDADAAVAAVRSHLGGASGERIYVLVSMSGSTRKRLGLTPGQVWLL